MTWNEGSLGSSHRLVPYSVATSARARARADQLNLKHVKTIKASKTKTKYQNAVSKT